MLKLIRQSISCTALLLLCSLAPASAREPLAISWEKNFLTISADWMAGPVRVNYLEAYCRPGSTDRDWGETVIKHQAELVSVSDDGRVIKLRDRLADGVVVDHVITAGADEVDFQITAHNPSDVESQADWAQPCIRLDKFIGTSRDDERTEVPAYARKCFLFIDGKLTMLPTKPWATKARYIPGQVYAPAGVDRNDVNPRPLSELVPSNGLCGCFSGDDKQIFAVWFEPYQEVFQGVISCMHTDFRIGGLKPNETKTIRGKMYVLPADADQLIQRYKKDVRQKTESE